MVLRAGTWAVLLGLLAVLAVAVVVPRVAGATPYAVLSGSMSPAYPTGALVVVRAVEPDAITIGSVITYQPESGREAVVTHRVVAVGIREGEIRYQTRGDANPVPDAEWVRPVQVRGEVWYAVPHLGRAGTLLDLRERRWGIWLLAGLLAIYGVSLFSSAYRDRRRRTPQGDHGDARGRHRAERDEPVGVP
ncbi:signal peptidase I [Nocardioides massiliensis]|uniref:Signal peptidase I n=1 Tax=Nocardioides massiliensis TaxID=1325935 RepID=A0ABT9NR08_9ACTN|nr:signal peptidase I [Nocardioides massiliensis]MDP9822813.1 signal peptidase [Nocardioides massiliensis]